MSFFFFGFSCHFRCEEKRRYSLWYGVPSDLIDCVDSFHEAQLRYLFICQVDMFSRSGVLE